MVGFQITPFDETLPPAWDRFCDQSDDACFWHLPTFLDYSLQYRPDLNPVSQSFAVVQDGKIVAICPLILESYPGTDGLPPRKEFSCSGSYGIAPAFSTTLSVNARRDVADAVFGEIDRLAASMSVQRASFRTTPLAPSFMMAPTPPWNFLTRYGYADASLATQLIDLRMDEDAILHGMTKGHKYDVRRGERLMTVTVFDGASMTRDVFDCYQRLHHLAAGRVTRPQSTFDKMFNWTQTGLSLLVSAEENGEYVGFSFLCTHGTGAYYASACNLPGRRDLPIAHALQWGAMRWLKANGYKHYELGWQQFGPLPYDFPSEKEIAIALFKRGFGGLTVPFFRGEKYYSADFYKAVTAERTERYASALANNAIVGERSA